MKRAIASVGWAALALALGATGCSEPPADHVPPTGRAPAPVVTAAWHDTEGAPDLLLITLDTFRADRAGSMGHPGGLTPCLDRILRPGLVAREAWAPAPLTAVSHATILTGLEPPTHGVRENGMFDLAPATPRLASVLSESGWRTGAVIAALPVTSRFGFQFGFDTFEEDLRMPDTALRYYAERGAPAIVDASLAWLDSISPSDRWFLWAHFFDPHQPWNPPAALLSLPAETDYEREIRAMDFEIRRLIRGVESWGGGRPPVTAIVSDHGEALGDHRESSHGILLYTETTRGLLGFAAPPGTPEATRLGAGIRLTSSGFADVLPTLLDILEVEPPADVEGVSWIDASARPAGIYGETYYPMIHYGWSPLLSWRDERWTYVEGPDSELFDRTTDPGEKRNVIDEHPEIAADFSRRIASIAREPVPADANSLDEETREQLLALGYVSGSAGPVDRSKDPKALIDVVNRLFRALSYSSEGNLTAALAMLQRAYRSDPENISVLFNLADCLRQSGDTPTARAYYRRAIDRDPTVAEAWGHLATLAFEGGDPEEAFALLEEGRGHSPRSTSLLLVTGDLRHETGDAEGAEAWYRRAMDADPGNPDPWVALARLTESLGRTDEADELWDRAAELWSQHPGLPPDRRERGGAGH